MAAMSIYRKKTLKDFLQNQESFEAESWYTQLAFYVNLHRAVIGPSATLTGRWRPDIDLRRMLTGYSIRDFLLQDQMCVPIHLYGENVEKVIFQNVLRLMAETWKVWLK